MDLAQEAPANLRCPKSKDNVFVYVQTDRATVD